MEKQEHTLEQQVWQRVRSSRAEGPKNDLPQLQREAMELAAVYRQLSARLTGRQQELAKQLCRGEQANAAVLAGIAHLSRQGGETVKLWQPASEEPMKLLTQCYYRSRRCITEYLARSAEGEYGVVFERLSKREGEHCVLIAQLLGMLR